MLILGEVQKLEVSLALGVAPILDSPKCLGFRPPSALNLGRSVPYVYGSVEWDGSV